ncbi:MAG TPA: DUF4328 domain-containing protein [Mycobacteriales bacterium]
MSSSNDDWVPPSSSPPPGGAAAGPPGQPPGWQQPGQPGQQPQPGWQPPAAQSIPPAQPGQPGQPQGWPPPRSPQPGWQPPAYQQGQQFVPPGWQPGAAPNQWGAPAYGLAPMPTPAPTRLAFATQILLAVIALFELVGALPVLFSRRSLVQRLVDNPESVSLDEANSSDLSVLAVTALFGLLFTATSIVFLIWFYRVRRNAGAYNTVPQQHSQGWAIGGWICPVVNLWFPYQMTADVLRASARPVPNQPPGLVSLGLVRGWWATYLLINVISLFQNLAGSGDAAGLLRSANLGLVRVIPTVVSAVLAIMVVRQITALQQERATTGQPG